MAGLKRMNGNYSERNEVFKDFRTNLSEGLVSRRALKLSENLFHPHSPYLNIYVYPNDLDYNVKNIFPRNGLDLNALWENVKKKTLIGSVNTLLDDFPLVRTMSAISYRMQNSETIKKGLNSYWKNFDSMNNFKIFITLALNHKLFS